MRSLIFSLLFFCSTASAYARDLYVIGMDGRGAPITQCSWLVWRGDVLFYNSGATAQRVRVLGVSNGVLDTRGHDEIEIPHGSVVSRELTTGTFWYPVNAEGLAPLWIWRLEVPEEIRVQSHMRLLEERCTPSLGPASRGEVALPAFEALVPANRRQVFLGTDLGNAERRVNVAVFNAGETPAHASLVLRRSCDNTVVASTDIVVSANTTVQVRLDSGTVPTTCAPPGAATGTYVTVEADQPGIAFVSALSNEEVTRLTHKFLANR